MQETATAQETNQPTARASGASTEALIDHVVERHAECRRLLPVLVDLAAKVECVHEGDPAAPAGLAGAIDALLDDLAAHTSRDERVLFPAMRAGLGELEGAIAAMRYEHDDHVAEVAVIRSLAHGCVPPAHACRSWRTLYRELDDCLAEIEAQVRLENTALFPRFEAGL